MLPKIQKVHGTQTLRNSMSRVMGILLLTLLFVGAGANIQAKLLQRGTFLADELFWSAENQEVYLKGEVRVNHGKNNFKGKGTFSVFGKVYFLVVNGEPVPLNTSVDLLGKKYEVRELTRKEAIKKYGEEGTLGALEVTVLV